ncbi:MMPL family transporter [Nocardia sp. NPDC049526]|uniref:MMPL family transporter n=1 Tax=Nocardia sp. NPDC049526 TaxID=3364316 RepID=UPI0037A380FE
MIYDRLAALALRRPWAIAIGAVVFFAIAGIIGAPALIGLPTGGYGPADAESAKAERILAEQFHAGGMTLVLRVDSDAGVEAPAARARAQQISAALHASPHAGQIVSYWEVPPGLSTYFVTADHKTGLIAAEVAGSDNDAPVRARDLVRPLLGERDGVRVSAGGQAIVQDDLNRESRMDLIRVEIIAVPFTFIALVWIFGSAVAAMLPLAVAGISIVGTVAVLEILSKLTDVSVFALNLATAMCMALAIDYTLLVINRYREQVTAGADRQHALRRTLATTGRAVTYSALTVALMAAAMAVFPMYFLRSLAYAGVAGAALALLSTLVVAPALIVLLGDRIDSFDLRKPVRRWLGRAEPRTPEPEQSAFYRLAIFAMRRAIPVTIIVTALFLVLGLPFLGVRLGYPDDRVLPTSEQSRQTGDLLRQGFTQNYAGTARIVLVGGNPSLRAVNEYAAALSRVPHVVTVAAPGGVYANGSLISPVAAGAGRSGDDSYLTVSTTEDPFSTAGQDQLTALKDVTPPATAYFDGLAQRSRDHIGGITDRAPLALALVALATFGLMFLLTGSVLLPIKALVMNLLSISAAFGALVWIFQDGHLGGFGVTTTGYLTASFVPLIFCLAYGLSMDYEIFVISRMREEWLKTGRTSADNQRAVAMGLARTGRIVTAAAVVMAIVFSALIASQLSTMRMLGTALTITVLLDAFLMRVVLLPAFMRLLGRANWWGPARLSGWHEKWAISEDDEPAQPPEPIEEDAPHTAQPQQTGVGS